MAISSAELQHLKQKIKSWSQELGFQQLGISDTDLTEAERFLNQWLKEGMHGEMGYMERHGLNRTRPESLIPGTLRIISVRMDYFPPNANPIECSLEDAASAFISRYATGRDYHKLIRKRLQKLANRIEKEIGDFSYRAFADSAPVMEKPIAQKAGLGWIGKHSNLINRKAGSWFFLGELYTDLPLPVDSPESDHCGNCSSCIAACPTDAIVAPYLVDARKCISYLTIEHRGSIPVEFRSLVGNRIFGCDDCQVVCPWNRFSAPSEEVDFQVRNHLDSIQLCEVFSWTEREFLERTKGSAIRRLGHELWLRNIAVALGNAPPSPSVLQCLNSRKEHASPIVREHVEWALHQHFIGQSKRSAQNDQLNSIGFVRKK